MFLLFATSPIGPAAGGAAAAAQVAPPKLLGLDKTDGATAALKEGEFTPEKVFGQIEEGIQSFQWAQQQLQGTTPAKAKKPEVAKAFQTSAAALSDFTNRAEALVKELKPLSGKHKLGPTVEMLKKQVEALKALVKAHQSMAKGNSTIEAALKGNAARKVLNPIMTVMEKADSPVNRQGAFAIINLASSTGIKPFSDAVATVQKKLNALVEFTTSPAIQALTPAAVAGRARTAMQNPNQFQQAA